MGRQDIGPPTRCASCPASDKGFCGAIFASCGDRAAFKELDQRFFTVAAGHPVGTDSDIIVLCSGWAFRYLPFSDGRRQIVKFLFTGDFASVRMIFSNVPSRADFSVKSLSDVQVCAFHAGALRRKCLTDPSLVALGFELLLQERSDAYELVSVLGQRPAEGRIAFLILSLMRRANAGRLDQSRRYSLPLRQQHIADTVGLTTVHVSRILAQFRDRGMLTISEGSIIVHDLPALEDAGALT